MEISLWDFKQRENLVILFHHGVDCSHCRKYLEELAGIFEEAVNNEAEILAVSFDPLEKLKKYAEKILFPLLSSSSIEAVEKFTRVEPAGKSAFPSIFITDRYGALRYQKVVKEAEDLPAPKGGSGLASLHRDRMPRMLTLITLMRNLAIMIEKKISNVPREITLLWTVGRTMLLSNN